MHKIGTNNPKFVPPYINSNSFRFGEQLLTMAPHNVLTKVVQSRSIIMYSMAGLNLNNLSTIEKFVPNRVLMGLKNIMLVS